MSFRSGVGLRGLRLRVGGCGCEVELVEFLEVGANWEWRNEADSSGAWCHSYAPALPARRSDAQKHMLVATFG